MGRKSDRRHAFSIIFALSFSFYDDKPSEADVLNAISYYLDNFAIEGASEIDYIKNAINGVFAKIEKIDNHIEKTAAAWDISRIAKADLAILRLAVYEIFYDKSIPSSVAINEAIDLAKEHSSDNSAPFVNGILSKIEKRRKIRKLKVVTANENKGI